MGLLTAAQIRQALECIPSDSDISGASNDSDGDENWLPARDRDQPESDGDDLAGEDVGPAGDIGGGAADDDLSDEELPGVPSTSSASAEPVQKRARIRLPQAANKERTEWVWTHEDLPPKDMPISKVRPKNLDHCRTDVQTFLAVLGEDNIQLFTEQSNRFRVKKMIDSNRIIPAITEREIRQWLGIHMYMSIVSMPSTRCHWKANLSNSLVPSVMKRDRFDEIKSCFHLADNNEQTEKGSPGYDRLFKVHQFLANLSNHFEEHAEIEEVLAVDEMMIPFKGHLWLKVYMKAKPKKWGIKVFALAGPTGYCYRFKISGDALPDEETEADDMADGIGMSGRTVLSLVRDVPPGCEVFFDNWFASPALLLRLK